jgi:hypothetical protein
VLAACPLSHLEGARNSDHPRGYGVCANGNTQDALFQTNKVASTANTQLIFHRSSTHLLQAPVLAPCPLSHLEGARSSEQPSSNGVRADGEQDPAPDLCGVVGAGDVVEEEAGGDLVRLFSGLAQVSQDVVAPAATATQQRN